jgi:hypothetical protein
MLPLAVLPTALFPHFVLEAATFPPCEVSAPAIVPLAVE